MAKNRGLTARTYSGLNKDRMKKGTGGNRCQFKVGENVTVQFLDTPAEMVEYDEHVFNDGGWKYVPCIGKGCPLCEDEDSDVRKIGYKMLANVYNFKTQKVEVLSGPKTLAGRIFSRYDSEAKRAKSKGKKNQFLNKTWQIDKLDQVPVSYDIDQGDKDAIQLGSKHKKFDLNEYINGDLQRYYGEDMPKPKKSKRSALDDDDADDDDAYDRDDLEEMSSKEVKAIAKSLKIKAVNPKTEEPRSKSALIKLILKNQD